MCYLYEVSSLNDHSNGKYKLPSLYIVAINIEASPICDQMYSVNDTGVSYEE